MKVAPTYLLAVEAVVWCEGKKLRSGQRPPELPLILSEGSCPDREAAQHPDRNDLWFVVCHQAESTAFFTLLGTPLPSRMVSTGPTCVS